MLGSVYRRLQTQLDLTSTCLHVTTGLPIEPRTFKNGEPRPCSFANIEEVLRRGNRRIATRFLPRYVSSPRYLSPNSAMSVKVSGERWIVSDVDNQHRQ
jgi:hypothetical protein